MPEERSHHTSKQRRYDILLVPREEAGQALRSIRIALWHMVTGGIVVTLFIVAAVLLLLVYTPLGHLVPIPNPELENRYNRELLSINERMSGLMEQLVEMRAYNVKLRQALGENVQLTDTGVVVQRRPQVDARGERTREGTLERRAPGEIVRPVQSRQIGTAQAPLTGQAVRLVDAQRVVFPALMPAEGFITRGFEPAQRHFGIDIAGKTGTVVSAAAEGHVIVAGWTHDDGNLVVISHPGGFLTFYKHNDALLTSANSFVRRGEPIALLGNSGATSSGPHLHFEIWKDGVPVDPTHYIVNMNF